MMMIRRALVEAKDASGQSIFAGGRNFTGFSNAEEQQAGKVKVPFHPSSSPFLRDLTFILIFAHTGYPLPP